MTNDFEAAYYPLKTWLLTRWMGHECHKYPSDLFILQEILHEVRPALVIELGTGPGGSTLFMANVLDMLQHGYIVSVDQTAHPNRPRHPRITYITGDTRDPKVIELVGREVIKNPGPVLIDHDANHVRKMVATDLRNYADLVTPGSYFIVEDTNLGAPGTAIEEFLAGKEDRWEIDRSREKFLLTMHAGGYLRRKT